MCQLLFWLCSQRDNRGADTAVAADVRSRPQAGQGHAEGPPSLFAQWRGCGCGRRRAKPSVGGAGPRRRAAKPVRPVARMRLWPQTCEAVRRLGRATPKGRQDCSPSGADAAVAADVRSRPQAGQGHAEGPPRLFAQWRGCGCGRRRAKKKIWHVLFISKTNRHTSIRGTTSIDAPVFPTRPPRSDNGRIPTRLQPRPVGLRTPCGG